MEPGQDRVLPQQQLDRQNLLIVSLRIWSRTPLDQFLFKEWAEDDDVVAFSKRSGDTHLLSPLPLALLALLGKSPETSRSLLDKLTAELTQIEPDEAFELIETTLIQLQDIGLVTHSSP